MRRVAVVALCALLAVPAAAQTNPQPTLILSIAGGAHTGHGLWEITKQPIPISNQPGNVDTVRFARSIGAGLAFGVSGTYYPSQALGLNFGLTFMDMPLENSCDSVFYHLDLQAKTEQMCDNFDGSLLPNSSFILQAGVTLRAAPRTTISPYLRGGVGVSFTTASTVEVASSYIAGGALFTPEIITDANPRTASFDIQLAAGVTAPVGQGYQLRVEARDDIFAFERVTGPADGFGAAPTEVKSYHHFTLLIGFDVVLERKRGRRY